MGIMLAMLLVSTVSAMVLAGAFELKDIYNCQDVDGLRFEDELERIGYKGKKAPASIPKSRKLSAD